MSTSMAAITGAVTTTVTSFSSMVETWTNVITGNGFLLFMVVGVPMVGIGIGLLKRLVRV